MYAIIQVSGLQEILNQLKTFRDTVKNIGTRQVGEYILDIFTNDVYESEGKEIGHLWPELSPTYSFQKYKKYGAQLTLVRTGTMRASNVLYTATDLITIKNVATDDNGEYYAAKHQYGSDRMPARVLMDLTEEHKLHIEDMIIEAINRRISRA